MNRRVDIQTDIEAPAAIVWRIITDTALWPQWGPSVRKVRCKDRFIRSKSTGRIQTVFGIWLPFEITDFVPGAEWSWRVSGVRATSHRVETVSGHRCRLIFGIPLVAAPYGFICKIAIKRIQQLSKDKKVAIREYKINGFHF
jgi:uncharacterized protein YndB with AHSA1/START domain